MKLTSLPRIVSGIAALGMLSTVVASAGVISRVSPMNHARPQLVTKVLHGIPMSPPSCPSEFTGGCYSIDSSSPFEAEWCVSDSGNCSSGLVSSVSWTADAFKAKNGKPAKKGFSASWSPNPGNPSIFTASTTKAKAKGKVKYGAALSGCYTGGCFTDFVVYGFQV
jgi:hypothetical protein